MHVHYPSTESLVKTLSNGFNVLGSNFSFLYQRAVNLDQSRWYLEGNIRHSEEKQVPLFSLTSIKYFPAKLSSTILCKPTHSISIQLYIIWQNLTSPKSGDQNFQPFGQSFRILIKSIFSFIQKYYDI